MRDLSYPLVCLLLDSFTFNLEVDKVIHELLVSDLVHVKDPYTQNLMLASGGFRPTHVS